jgi:hypothetical protein
LSEYKFGEWRNASQHGFSFYFDKLIPAGETWYLKMPVVSPNKRGVNDIGFAYEDGITLYATLSEDPMKNTAIWSRINDFDEINKTVACIKIVNNDTENAKRVNIRAILN